MYKSQITTDVSISNIRIFQVLLFMNAGTFVFKTIHSLNRSFPGTFVPGTVRLNPSDLSLRGPFVPWTVRSIVPGTLPGPFLPWTIHSFVSTAVPDPLTKKEQRNKQKRRPMTATVHSCYIQTVDRRYSASCLNQLTFYC